MTTPYTALAEAWATIRGYEGRYSVSNHGRVYSIISQKFLSPGTDENGYLRVTLGNGTKSGESRRVHLLVKTSFDGPTPPGMEVAHDNGNNQDNRLENLVWKSHAENCRDTVRHGKSTRGSANPRAKITEADVLAIRASQNGCRKLARQYGVASNTIVSIRNRKTWTHI